MTSDLKELSDAVFTRVTNPILSSILISYITLNLKGILVFFVSDQQAKLQILNNYTLLDWQLPVAITIGLAFVCFNAVLYPKVLYKLKSWNHKASESLHNLEATIEATSKLMLQDVQMTLDGKKKQLDTALQENASLKQSVKQIESSRDLDTAKAIEYKDFVLNLTKDTLNDFDLLINKYHEQENPISKDKVLLELTHIRHRMQSLDSFVKNPKEKEKPESAELSP